MTVRELRDRLDSFIKSDKRNGNARVCFDDDELGLLFVDSDEVLMVKPLDTIVNRYCEKAVVGETICCLNTVVNSEHDRLSIRGTEVVPPETFRTSWDKVLNALRQVGREIAERVYWLSGTGEKMGRLEGCLMNDQTKDLIKVYRAQFIEDAKERFESEYRRELSENLTPEQIQVVEKVATEMPPLHLQLSGEEFDQRKPETVFMNGIVVTRYGED